MTDKEYVAYPVLCLTCGFDGDHPVEAKGGIPEVDICRCPKCSKIAYVLRPFRERIVIAALAKELIQLRLDMMDLQGVAERVHDIEVTLGGME